MSKDDNVVLLPCITRLDLPAERVLEQAIKADLKQAVIVGEHADGREYFASTTAGGPEVLWMLERAKLKLLGVVDRSDLPDLPKEPAA